MKKKQKKIRFTWITVWLVVAAVAFLSFVGYAAYTGVTSVKRVVSTRAGVGILFSSNYMKQGSTAQVSIEYHSPDEFAEGRDPSYNMIVCNFSQSDRATWYTASDLRYNLTATLYLNEKYTADDGVDSFLIGHYKTPTAADIAGKHFGIKFSGDSSYTYFSDSNWSVTLPSSSTTYTLSKNEASTDMFNVLFDRSELQCDAPRFWIHVQATPTSVSAAEIETMSGYIGTCKNATIGANWTGYIEDDRYSTVDYDAYNYIITGNGNGSFYFAWDDSKVKPNEFALSNYASDIEAGTPANVSSWTNYKRYGTTAPSVGTWKYIKLKVDSDVTARYEIQLYKTSGADYHSSIADYTDYYFVAEQAVTP